MTDHLFDPDVYGNETVRRTRRGANQPTVEPTVEPWVLLADTNGILGWHVPKHVNEFATATTLCGLQGHVVESPPQMVRCAECATNKRKR